MFRLIGLLGGLALVTDLGTGAPLEESLRRCLVATRLARRLGCENDEIRDVLYTALLQHLGCMAYSHETARMWGDDVAVNRVGLLTNFADPKDVFRTFLPGIAAETGANPVRTFATGALLGSREGARHQVATCEVARDAARRLRLPDGVQTSLFQTLAWWNGRGYPSVAGEEISLATRMTHVASTAVLFLLRTGPEAALVELDRRSGGCLDPDLVAALRAHRDELLGDVEDLDAYQEVLDAEPDPVHWVDDPDVEAVAGTFGDLVDLKSPALHGHSARVAALAGRAVRRLGVDGAAGRTVRLAGHLHDLGRAGVSSRIWDKPRPLTSTEWDQVRLHAYHSERILARVPELADVARLVGQHHERCDGSGYHHGVGAAELTLPTRVLAAADVYAAMVTHRPHRAPLAPEQAARELLAQARAGRLDGDAVSAVLDAAGHPTGVRRAWPAGLTDRQVEVLRLLAQGLSNRDIARRLVISSRTAEHHVQDIYVKIGASTRAAAALFAMGHGLLDRPV